MMSKVCVERCIHCTAYATVLAAVGVLLAAAYMVFMPYEFVVINGPVEPTKTQYRIGDLVQYTVDYCAPRAGENTVTYEFIAVDKLAIGNKAAGMPTTVERKYRAIEVGHAVVPAGCFKAVAGIARVPFGVPPGWYLVRITVGRQINPLHYATQAVDTMPLEVIE